MPARTGAKAPAARVYSSPAVQQQAKFKTRKRNVTARRSLETTRKPHQQTLTQIDFLSLQEALNQDDDNENLVIEEEEPIRKRKRRRTDGNAPSLTSKFHTQTLTQLEFVSDPASRLDDIDDIENNIRGVSPDCKREIIASPVRDMGPPKTPSRRRAYEVPSSQSPLSAASIRSRRSLPMRSPLKALDLNSHVQSFSPVRRRGVKQSPGVKLEIQDTFEYENFSQQSRVPQTPQHSSSPKKRIKLNTEPKSPLGSRKKFKTEIQDSDEEDEDLDIYDDDDVDRKPQLASSSPAPSSQIDINALTRVSSDTQEAEEQLQSTILQFTQTQIPSTTTAEAAKEQGENDDDDDEKESQTHFRPSQATTVSLTQAPSSSPFSRRPQQQHQEHPEKETPGAAATAEGDGDEQQDYCSQLVLLIPDSPSHQPLPPARAPPSSSSPLSELAAAAPFHHRDAPSSSLPISQLLLTRSQMLPDSLMLSESVPAPPELWRIEDSDLDDGDYEDEEDEL